MQHIKLRRMPFWLAASPWLVVVGALLLAAMVFFVGVRNAKRESEITRRIIWERGASIIASLEGALRSGMGGRWTEEELQEVLSRIATQPQVQYLAITDAYGMVVASSNSTYLNQLLMPENSLHDLSPLNDSKWAIVRSNAGLQTFLVYKVLHVPRYKERLRAKGMMHHRRGMGFKGDNKPRVNCFKGNNELNSSNGLNNSNGLKGSDPSSNSSNSASNNDSNGISDNNNTHTPLKENKGNEQVTDGVLSPDQTLLIFVGFSMDELVVARALGASNTFTISAILVFMGITGGLGFALVQAYRRSRLVVQEATAFSSEMIKTLPMGIIATNELRQITTINHAALKIMDCEHTSPLGQDLAQVLPGIWGMLKDELEAQRPILDLELRCDLGSKRHVPLALYASSIVTEGDKFLGYALIMRDLGEIRHLQAELRRRDRLVALGNMAAGIAHEIRNPLGAIKGLARFFEEISPLDSQEQKIAKVMSQEVGRLDKVVGDMLNFARPDVLNCQVLNLDQVAAIFGQVKNLVQADLDTNNVHFILDFPDSKVNLWLDPDSLTQAVLNLYLNAIQAMPKGGELKTTAKVLNQSLEISIADTGTGIDPEKLSHIFSPYFTTKASGTGLGLSIVHKIVEAHDGTIEAKSNSKLEPGATVLLRFPLHMS